jgi:hypothetical protein
MLFDSSLPHCRQDQLQQQLLSPLHSYIKVAFIKTNLENSSSHIYYKASYDDPCI